MKLEEVIEKLTEVIDSNTEREGLNLTWELRNSLLSEHPDGKLDNFPEVSATVDRVDFLEELLDEEKKKYKRSSVSAHENLQHNIELLRTLCLEFEEFIGSKKPASDINASANYKAAIRKTISTIEEEYRRMVAKFVEEYRK